MHLRIDFAKHLQVRLDHIFGKHIVAVGPHYPFAILDQRIRNLKSMISCSGEVIHMRPRSAQRRVKILADPAPKLFCDAQSSVWLQAAGGSNNDDLVADFL